MVAVVASPAAVVTCRVSWDAHVAGDEQPRQRRRHVGVGDEIAGGVVLDVLLEDAGVRREADEDEDRRSPASVVVSPVIPWRSGAGARARSASPSMRSTTVFQTTSIFGFSKSTLLDDLRRAELVAAVDEIDLGGVAREIVGLFARRVAAAHHRDRVPLEERAVADRAVRDALPRVLDLAGDAELHRRAARREDRDRRAIHVAALSDRLEGAVGKPAQRHGGDAGDDLGAELPCVRLELLRELPAVHGFEARVVLDLLGVEQLAAGGAALEHHGLEHAAAGIEPRGESRRSGADDHDVIVERACHEPSSV